MNLSLMVIIVGSFILTTSYVSFSSCEHSPGSMKWRFEEFERLEEERNKKPKKRSWDPCNGVIPDGYSTCGELSVSGCYCTCCQEPGKGNCHEFENAYPPKGSKCRRRGWAGI